MDGMRLEMVEAINASAPNSNARLFVKLRAILKGTEPLAVGGTLIAFDCQPEDFLELLNAIPISVRNSLVLGTIAYDFHDGAGEKPYAGDYQGVYVVGIAVYRNKIRTGEFLNSAEIAKLADAIDEYCVAWDAWKRYRRLSSMTVTEAAAMRLATRVDEAYRGVNNRNERVLLLDNATQCEKAKLLARKLRARCKVSLDPTRLVYQRQSPLYVGCSSKPVKLRTAQHDPNSGLRGTNPLLALTLSSIKAALDLVPETVVVPVLQTWTEAQLPVGEQLVTGLASSLVYEGGMNIIQGGGKKGINDPIAEHHVLGTKSHFVDNAQATLEEFRANAEIRRHLISLRSLYSGADRDLLDKLEKSVVTFKQLAIAYRKQLDEELALLAEAKERQAELAAALVTVRQARIALYEASPRDGDRVSRTPGFSSSPATE